MQGPLAHAQAVSGLALEGPVGAWLIGVDAKDRSSGDRRSEIDPSADPAKGDGCVQGRRSSMVPLLRLGRSGRYGRQP